MKSKLLSPRYFNLFFLLALALHFILPIQNIIFPLHAYLGFTLIFLGLILNFWSVATLKRNNTSIDFNNTPTRLVTDGVFRISRNPIYLSGVVFSLGVSILLGSLVVLIFSISLLLVLNKYHIPYEEIELEKIFGKEYLEYKHKVRRWL